MAFECCVLHHLLQSWNWCGSEPLVPFCPPCSCRLAFWICYCTVLSLQGSDGGTSSSGNVSGVTPATPAGGSRSSSRNIGSSGPEKEEGKKVRRQWESWSTEDKNTFFEGLYEVSCVYTCESGPQWSSSWALTVYSLLHCCEVGTFYQGSQGSCHLLPGAFSMRDLSQDSQLCFVLISC